ncbi:MAG: D-alanyl-D-alanine carboxypeptidase/D-alanyl-D-alanine-endopeptidase (penicillin-binding protein 4) [Cyclobacteriaceae bacterium]|jgi:D-alanyl-D-alanine carboxypeptidase/D-alanyl-D-alanine-endopeptidase (penicillin-binding protein 4)
MHFLKKKTARAQQSFIVIFCVASLALNSCKSLEISILRHDIKKEIKKNNFFKNQFTGFCLFDPKTNTYVSEFNANHYFNPASNTKILTALSVIDHFGDSIPSFALSQTSKDSFKILPLADPTFLHPAFPNDSLISKLRKFKNLTVCKPNTQLAIYGPGWAWDDYPYYFQPERSYFPIYGNVVEVSFDSSLSISPSFFSSYTNLLQSAPLNTASYRDLDLNIFNTWLDADSSAFSRIIPFKTSPALYEALFKSIIPNIMFEVYDSTKFSDTIYSQSTRNVLALMMKTSDNFLAEQLLIQSGIIDGNWDVDVHKAQLLKDWSSFLTSQPQWYDGSGLSRYNLITPKSLVEVLNQIYQRLSFEEIKSVFPIGGESGTIRNYYKSETPYIIAKTGTLKNNHCLSGYLMTNSGKTLIFSFMNNHYIGSSDQAKVAMEQLLIKIRDHY